MCKINKLPGFTVQHRKYSQCFIIYKNTESHKRELGTRDVMYNMINIINTTVCYI